jgi:hypothetical protein
LFYLWSVILYTFDKYYEYEWLWCENWNQGRDWDQYLETVNCVCSGKCCGQLIPKCDRPGETMVVRVKDLQLIHTNATVRQDILEHFVKVKYIVIIYRRVWRYRMGNHNKYIKEEQITQWPKEKAQKKKEDCVWNTWYCSELAVRYLTHVLFCLFYIWFTCSFNLC